MFYRTLLAASFAAIFSTGAWGAVSAEEAKQLGTTLTPTGAEKAGNAIWIAEGRFDGERVHIERCGPAAGLPDSGPERTYCLPALVNFIATQGNAIIGCDFPFSLPSTMIDSSGFGKTPRMKISSTKGAIASRSRPLISVTFSPTSGSTGPVMVRWYMIKM